jgi:hypothetical protein
MIQTAKVEFQRLWTVVNSHGGGEVNQSYRGKKREVYRRCRRMNGKKDGGNRPYRVQRVTK